jgi:hypothetical protein
MGQLVDVLNASSNITFKEAKGEDFLDFGGLLDVYYKKFPAGTIQCNHVFWVEESTPTTIYTKTSDEADDVQAINLKTTVRNRLQNLQSHVLTLIPTPGLKEIKQVEMYTKFRKFVPEEYRDEICPRPSEQVLANVKKSRSEKAKARSEKARANVRRRRSG